MDKVTLYKSIKFLLTSIIILAGFYIIFIKKLYRLGFELVKK